MAEEPTEETTLDPWDIADEIDDMIAGMEPDDDKELPSDAMLDPDWVRRRLIAYRFVLQDLANAIVQFETESTELDEQVNAKFGKEFERIEARRQKIVGQLESAAESLAWQLMSWHKAYSATARKMGRKQPVSIKMPQGTLISKAPSVPATITVHDQEGAVAWLVENNLAEHEDGELEGDPYMVRPAKVTPPAVDIVKARKLVVIKNGEVLGLVTELGAVCPPELMTAEVGDRRFSVDVGVEA